MRMPSAEAAVSGLKQCRQAQEQLEDAISRVTKAEQELRENAREVRAELQSCVSRQQEALRCREVWLLGQIELLEQLKTETLQQQLHQLHRLRGQFDVLVHQMHSSNSSNDLSNQLTSCMERLSSLSLTPEETPELSFQGDARSLRQAITSFGCITAQPVEGVSSQSSAHNRRQMQSCPIAAKKQKMEAAALGEWLLGTQPAIRATASHMFSKNPEDWLAANKETKTSCPALATIDFMQAWGQLRDLEAWLLQEQPTPVSRERTHSSCSSSFSIEKIDESEFITSPEEEDEEDISDWLITPSPLPMDTVSDAERWQRVLKPFEDNWLSSDWLVESSPPTADCSSCCQTTKAVEIENLGLLKCLKTPPASTPTTPTPATSPAALEAWLQQVVPLQQTCKANEVCSTYSACVCDENCGREALNLWLLKQDGRDKNGVPVTKNTSPAAKNAPATTDKNAPPTTDKNAPPTTPKNVPLVPVKSTPPPLNLREKEQKVQAILEAWLHPAKPSSTCRVPLQALTSSLSSWVIPEEEKASREEHSSQFKSSSSSSPFQHPLDPGLWVLPGQTPPPSQSSESEGQHHPAGEEDKWLLKKRSQAQEPLALPTVCDLFSCMKVGGDKDKWLHRAAEQM
ncbi:nuclear receptor coactivator 4 isoform X2 [Notolabrus celidotus]|uniref:nuclear receptor coactivator 4 isoform X2 n=1 Tax=Notolabrus celidotus TaxID=1203425 RepID=UPI00148F5F29|nr:nuclear receptor coactivator 4 isoform X2 [Notolabrus celidotus]